MRKILDEIKKIYIKYNVSRYSQESSIFTHLDHHEKFMLRKLSIKARGNAFVEIGSYLGASSCFIAAGIEKSANGGKLYCIDTWKNDTMTEGKQDTYKDFLKNTSKYKNIIVPIRGFSEEAVRSSQLEKKNIDFLFIDGDHSYTGCKSDWNLFFPLLKKGAIVIFHDSGWAEGVQRVIREEVLPLVKRQDSMPNMWWGWVE
jgi:predicted O-methyltransferase YrrM